MSPIIDPTKTERPTYASYLTMLQHTIRGRDRHGAGGAVGQEAGGVMSKYARAYVSSNGTTWAIEALPNGHLQNAAKKLRAALDRPDYAGENDQVVLECLLQEIEAREAVIRTEAEDEADSRG